MLKEMWKHIPSAITQGTHRPIGTDQANEGSAETLDPKYRLGIYAQAVLAIECSGIVLGTLNRLIEALSVWKLKIKSSTLTKKQNIVKTRY
jgi:hypothetical protein